MRPLSVRAPALLSTICLISTAAAGLTTAVSGGRKASANPAMPTTTVPGRAAGAVARRAVAVLTTAMPAMEPVPKTSVGGGSESSEPETAAASRSTARSVPKRLTTSNPFAVPTACQTMTITVSELTATGGRTPFALTAPARAARSMRQVATDGKAADSIRVASAGAGLIGSARPGIGPRLTGCGLTRLAGIDRRLTGCGLTGQAWIGRTVTDSSLIGWITSDLAQIGPALTRSDSTGLVRTGSGLITRGLTGLCSTDPGWTGSAWTDPALIGLGLITPGLIAHCLNRVMRQARQLTGSDLTELPTA